MDYIMIMEDESKYFIQKRRNQKLFFDRKIDMLASSTTLFSKEFGGMNRDQSQFFRQLRDTGTGSLKLFPTDFVPRSNKERVIRDQIAFNLVIFAATQCSSISIQLQEFAPKIQKKSTQSQPISKSSQIQANKQKSRKSLSFKQEIDNLQIQTLIRQFNFFDALKEPMDVTEMQSANGNFQDLQQICINIPPFSEDRFLIVGLNFIRNLLQFFASGKYKLCKLEKLQILMDPALLIKTNKQPANSVNNEPQYKKGDNTYVKQLIVKINKLIVKMLKNKYFVYGGRKVGKQQGEEQKRQQYIKTLCICPDTFDVNHIFEKDEHQQKQQDNIGVQDQNEEQQQKKGTQILTVKSLDLKNCSGHLMNDEQRCAKRLQQIFQCFPRTKFVKVEMEKKDQQRVIFTNFVILVKKIAQFLPLTQTIFSLNTIVPVEALKIILCECPYVYYVKVDPDGINNECKKLMSQIHNRIITIQNLLDTIKILKTKKYDYQTIRMVINRIKPLKVGGNFS